MFSFHVECYGKTVDDVVYNEDTSLPNNIIKSDSPAWTSLKMQLLQFYLSYFALLLCDQFRILLNFCQITCQILDLRKPLLSGQLAISRAWPHNRRLTVIRLITWPNIILSAQWNTTSGYCSWRLGRSRFSSFSFLKRHYWPIGPIRAIFVWLFFCRPKYGECIAR